MTTDDSLGFHPKWVKPFYMRFGGDFLTLSDAERSTLAQELRAILAEIDPQTLNLMLSSSNWRPRSVAGYFIGFGKFIAFTTRVGENLLNHPQHALMYSFALTRINTDEAVEYLQRFLREFLQPQYARDLFVDSLSVHAAVAALQLLDEQNHTHFAQEFYPEMWKAFAKANLEFLNSPSLQNMYEIHWSSDSIARTRKFLESLIKFSEENFD